MACSMRDASSCGVETLQINGVAAAAAAAAAAAPPHAVLAPESRVHALQKQYCYTAELRYTKVRSVGVLSGNC